MIQQEKLEKTAGVGGESSLFRTANRSSELANSRELHLDWKRMVKVMVFRDRESGRYIVTAVPGDRKVSRGLLHEVVGTSRANLELVALRELEEITGYIPVEYPFGFGRNFSVFFDRDLLAEKTLYCSAELNTIDGNRFPNSTKVEWGKDSFDNCLRGVPVTKLKLYCKSPDKRLSGL